jgi:hypothetical protein
MEQSLDSECADDGLITKILGSSSSLPCTVTYDWQKNLIVAEVTASASDLPDSVLVSRSTMEAFVTKAVQTIRVFGFAAGTNGTSLHGYPITKWFGHAGYESPEVPKDLPDAIANIVVIRVEMAIPGTSGQYFFGESPLLRDELVLGTRKSPK